MEIYYNIVFFVFGTIFGSFYNVVGDRLPEGKSISKPGSHCPICGHFLKPIELIPIFSYLMQGGKCKSCKTKIPVIHPLFEIFTGLMFMLSYMVFGLTPSLMIALTFISMLLIIIVSDINYFIIPDEVLIVGGILLVIETLCVGGLTSFGISLFNGLIAFLIMFGIKLFGDFLFKKESMGGGDIKLMFFFGFVLGWDLALMSIFLGSIIGLPISLIIMARKNTNIIPFGPMLSLAAIILLLTQTSMNEILGLIS